MAAPTFQAAGAGQTSTGAALSVPWPAHNPDDVGLLIVETTGTSSTMTTPTGWTAVAGTPLVDVASVAGSKFYVFWKRASSSAEPNVSTGAQTDHQDAMIVTYRGVLNTGTPIDVSATATKAVASTTATMPTITTTSVTTLVVLIASRPNDSAATNHFSTLTNAALTGLLKDAEWGTTDGDGGGMGVAHGTKAVAGVVGTTTWTKGSSTTDTTLSIALLPMPTPPSAPTYRPPTRTRRRILVRFNRRSGPVTPLTQTVVVASAWVPAVESVRRPRPLLRRRSQPAVPLTQTGTVIVSWVPPVVVRRRPARPLLRRRQQPSAPPVIAVWVPAVETPRRAKPSLRRRQQPTSPLVVALWVPAVETPRRAKPSIRRRGQPLVPLTQIVVIPDAVYQPQVIPAHRVRGFLRRRTMPTVPLTQAVTVTATFTPQIQRAPRRHYDIRRGQVTPTPATQIATITATYVPAIESPRRARAFTRRRTQPTTPSLALVYVPAIESPRRPRPFLRRRVQPSAPKATATFTPPTVARPVHRFYRPRRGTTATATVTVTVTVTTARPPQIPRARRFAWLRRRLAPQPIAPASISAPTQAGAGTGATFLVALGPVSSLVTAGTQITVHVDTAPAADVETVTVETHLVTSLSTTRLVTAGTAITLMPADASASWLPAGTSTGLAPTDTETE